jgi:3-oxoacyl-(acyl-carrier-protein) synthase
MNALESLPPAQKRKLLAQLVQKRNRGTLEHEIAIVGVAGRYPQSPDLFQFWQCLKSGRVCTSEIPPERWDCRDFYDPDPLRAFEGKSYCKWGGFLEGISRFDARFFHVTPREAEMMDPQERLFLETAWCALEDAGYARDLRQSRQTGVFLGVTTTGYPWVLAEKLNRRDRLFPNASFASLANRVSYFFNFQGPSLPVDTMCSSALTAIVLACQSILRGECDSALAGGVNLYPHPSKYLCLSQMGIASRDGTTRSFAQGGKGFVPGEGVGAVFLKPLLQALKDGDAIYATIVGSAINHTGKSSTFLAPNPNAQAALAIKALQNARLSPRSISYVEAQGLGSELVDAVEVAGLTRAYRHFTPDRQFCALGTLKPNFGHAEAASGIAQLTKVLLQLKWKTLCPSLIAEPLNPQISFSDSPFYLQRDLTAWPALPNAESGGAPEQPRRAAICAHGAGGSSAHLIIEEFENPESHPEVGPGPWLFPFSAQSRASLNQTLARYLEYLDRPDETGPQDAQFLQNLAFTLQTRREPMPERVALVAGSPAALASELRRSLETGKASSNGKKAGPPLNGDAGRLLESAQAWVQGQPLPPEHIIRAHQARPISLPPYCFEPTCFWVRDDQETNLALRHASLPKLVVLSSALDQHRHFFDSLQTYYRCQVLDWFQKAGLLLPASRIMLPDLLHRSPAAETHAWLRWLLGWLEAGRLLCHSEQGVQLTDWGCSAEIQAQLQALDSRRGLILRAIPEIEPHLSLLDLTGGAFRALFAPEHIKPATPEELSFRPVFASSHRFARQLESQIRQALEEHFHSAHPPSPVRVLETGLGSFAPLRAALSFFINLCENIGTRTLPDGRGSARGQHRSQPTEPRPSGSVTRSEPANTSAKIDSTPALKQSLPSPSGAAWPSPKRAFLGRCRPAGAEQGELMGPVPINMPSLTGFIQCGGDFPTANS